MQILQKVSSQHLPSKDTAWCATQEGLDGSEHWQQAV
jgi:hypothetical protein